MTLEIRHADLEADRELIIDRLLRWLTPDSDDRRFDWLYRDNPAGQARVFIGKDVSNDSVFGIGSAFPRRLYVDGGATVGWVLGDFCVDPDYRSLGPALQLQRACLEVVESDRPSFCYDFPSRSMMAIYRRIGIKPAGQLVRLARPIRVDRKVRDVVNVPGIARALSAAGNLAIGLRDAISRTDRTVSVSQHEGLCGEEFTALGRAQGVQHGLCLDRSAEYLNWRYLESTVHRHELLTARRAGDLLGYAVFTSSDEDATLVDLFGVEEPGVLGSLVQAVVRALRNRAVVTLSAPIWEHHPWMPLMKDLGFSAREASPVVVYSSPDASEAPRDDGRDWFLWQGDRDC